MKAKIEETVKAESVKTSQTATESAAIIKPGLTKAERAFLERQEKQVSGSIVMDNEIVPVSILMPPFSPNQRSNIVSCLLPLDPIFCSKRHGFLKRHQNLTKRELR